MTSAAATDDVCKTLIDVERDYVKWMRGETRLDMVNQYSPALTHFWWTLGDHGLRLELEREHGQLLRVLRRHEFRQNSTNFVVNVTGFCHCCPPSWARTLVARVRMTTGTEKRTGRRRNPKCGHVAACGTRDPQSDRVASVCGALRVAVDGNVRTDLVNFLNHV